MPALSWNRKIRRVEGSEQIDGARGPAVYPFAYERGVDGVGRIQNPGGEGTIFVTKERNGRPYVHATINVSHCSLIIYMEPET